MISVCMATFNGAKTIKRQLLSIIKQLNNDDQIIIVDDKSSDETCTIITNIKNKYFKNIVIEQNKENIGPIRGFEKAILMAQGNYIFLSDQDDIWNPDKVAKVMLAFSKGADLVVHDGVVVDGNLKVIDKSWNHYNHNELNQGLIANTVRNGYTGAMMAFSKQLSELAVPFPIDIPMHDQWLFDIAKMEKLKITVIDEPLMQYVRHGNNVTGIKKRNKLIMLKDRLLLVKEIIKYRLSSRH